MLNLRRFFATSALALLSVGAVACEGMSEGDYTVYRVSYSQAELGDACFDGEPNPSIEEDTSSLNSAATFILYIAADETPMLDTGALVLEGKDNGDDSYTFSGESRDIEVPAAEIMFDSDKDGLNDMGEDMMVDADGDGLDDLFDDDSVDLDGDGLHDWFEDDIVDANGDMEDDRIVEIPAKAKYISTQKVTIELSLDAELVKGSSKQLTELSCEGEECPPDLASKCTVTRDFSGIEMEDANVDVAPGEVN